MAFGDIDLPGLKHILWHKMRDDLKQYIPGISSTDLLLCPACCRFLPFDSFGVEHVVPRQALADDPVEAREVLHHHQRTVTTLLCTKELLIKGKHFHSNGCNGWKGRFYDRPLREIFNGSASQGRRFTARHHVALFSACYLGLFCKFGFQITLLESGLTMRKQFFTPDGFLREIPVLHQIALMGSPPKGFDEYGEKYWCPPFKFSFEDGCSLTVVRNASMRVPLSRNPEMPIAHSLPFAPSRFKLRPNFETVFSK